MWSHLEKHIPDQSPLPKHYLSLCYEETSGSIISKIEDAFIWVSL
jgi:hypothetical protein